MTVIKGGGALWKETRTCSVQGETRDGRMIYKGRRSTVYWGRSAPAWREKVRTQC